MNRWSFRRNHARHVSDRFGQLAPKVLFCVDSYRYGGRDYDRSAEVERIIALLPSLEQVIHVPGPAGQAITEGQAWDEVMNNPPVPAAKFEFEQVPFGHPLWPGQARVGWKPCICAAAREGAERGRGMGHLLVSCQTCHVQLRDATFYEPPHDIRCRQAGPWLC